MENRVSGIGKINGVSETGEMKGKGEIVERYCPRLDTNVTVYRDLGEKTGYVCSLADRCEFSHCMMSVSSKMTDKIGKTALSAKI